MARERKQVLRDVKDADVDQVVARFEGTGVTITKEKQPNGSWIVTINTGEED